MATSLSTASALPAKDTHVAHKPAKRISYFDVLTEITLKRKRVKNGEAHRSL
jgi:hypothetical protein